MHGIGKTCRAAVFALPLALAGIAAGADPPAGPAETGAVAVLAASVAGLADAGTLPPRAARALSDALKNARKALTRGDSRAAASFLAAYVHGVDADVRKGTISSAQGAALGIPARALVETLRSNPHGRIAPTGSSGAARADFNHDGFGDLAVAAPGRTVGGKSGAGAVYVLYGTANGLSAAGAQMWTQDTAGTAQRAARGAHFGSSLASGDFDGDGFTDLAIGAPGAAAGGGHVDVLFGSSSGIAADRTEEIDIRKADAALPQGAGWNFGAALAWADFNGDGFGDLAVGVPGFDRSVPRPGAPGEQVLVRHAGLACVFFGSAGGLLATDGSPASAPQVVAPRDASAAAGLDPGTANEGDRFGSALAAGKFDAGAFADLAIAAPLADVTLPTGVEGTVVQLPAETAYLDAGRVVVAFGSAAGLDLGAVRTITQDTFLDPGAAGQPGRSDYGDRFGTTMAAGDADGDGVAELAIAAPSRDSVGAAGERLSDTGAVYVLYGNGSRQTWSQGGALPDAAEAGDRFGSALAFGDFDGDGKKDLGVGVPFEDLADTSGATLQDCGVVHVIYGSATGLDAARNQFLRRPGDFADAAIVLDATPARRGDRFGAALTAWNFNGIPSPAELAVGVPFADVGKHRDTGAVDVVYGRPGGLDATGGRSWRSADLGSSDAGGTLFGSTLY